MNSAAAAAEVPRRTADERLSALLHQLCSERGAAECPTGCARSSIRLGSAAPRSGASEDDSAVKSFYDVDYNDYNNDETTSRKSSEQNSTAGG